MANTNRQVLLKRRPNGSPTPADFEVIDAPIPDPADGEVLVRGIYLSLDPYMRGPDQRRPVICQAGRDWRGHRRSRCRASRVVA
jgi:NADPH-dependent curcumin reductase CurA